MKNWLLGLAILPFMAAGALAGQPLTDTQMDKVTAGHDLSLVETTDVSVIGINVNEPVTAPPATVTQPDGTVATTTVIGNVILPLTTIQVWWVAIN